MQCNLVRNGIHYEARACSRQQERRDIPKKVAQANGMVISKDSKYILQHDCVLLLDAMAC